MSEDASEYDEDKLQFNLLEDIESEDSLDEDMNTYRDSEEIRK